MKAWKTLALIAILGFSLVSCSSDSSVTVVISDDDLLGDVSNGPALVGAGINGFGEWVAAGSQGIGYGSGTRTDFNMISMGTGSTDADRAMDINDNGNFIAAFENGIYFGDVGGALTQVAVMNNGRFIAAAINENNTWLVASEDGVYIGIGPSEPTFLDYVNNVGEFSHCALNDYDELVAAGSLQVLYGYIDDEGVVQLFSYDPVSVSTDAVWTDINDYGEFIATGTLQTLLGLADGAKSAVTRIVRKSGKPAVKPEGKAVPLSVKSAAAGGSLKVNRHYKAWFLSHDSRLQVAKAQPIYHSCAINNYGEYVAAGDDYLLHNDTEYNPVTAWNEMVAVDINDLDQWVAAGTEGLYVDGAYMIDGMGVGDYLALKQDMDGNFVFCTSYSSYHYNATTGSLIDDGPVADRGFPVSADLENRKWIAVGNYGVLLWNY